MRYRSLLLSSLFISMISLPIAAQAQSKNSHNYEQSANLALGQGDYRERLADKPDPTQTGFNDAAVRSIIRAYKDMDIAVEHQGGNAELLN